MRNFIITVNGKNYEVGVEEVGAGAQAPPSFPLRKRLPKPRQRLLRLPKRLPRSERKSFLLSPVLSRIC